MVNFLNQPSDQALLETLKVNITITDFPDGLSNSRTISNQMKKEKLLNRRIEKYGQSFLTYRYLLHSLPSVLRFKIAKSGDLDDTLVCKIKKRKIDAEKAKGKDKDTSKIPPECVLLIAEYLDWKSFSSKPAVPIILKHLLL